MTPTITPVCEHRCPDCGSRWHHTEPRGGCGLDAYARCSTCRIEQPGLTDPPLLARVGACAAGAIWLDDAAWLIVWNGSRTFNVFDADGVVHAFTADVAIAGPDDAEAYAAEWYADVCAEEVPT